jgi:membrane peptidoglycan carboxypeptidase
VTNSTGTNGVMNMYRRAEMSVNTYFVQLELATGMCRVTKMAKKLGVKSGAPNRPLVDYYQDEPAFTLDSVEVSPLSMAPMVRSSAVIRRVEGVRASLG